MTWIISAGHAGVVGILLGAVFVGRTPPPYGPRP